MSQLIFHRLVKNAQHKLLNVKESSYKLKMDIGERENILHTHREKEKEEKKGRTKRGRRRGSRKELFLLSWRALNTT